MLAYLRAAEALKHAQTDATLLLARGVGVRYDHDMISINRDTLATYFIADINSCPLPDLIASIASCSNLPTDAIDDSAILDFAELDIIDERDALESLLDCFAYDAPSDDALDDAATLILDTLRDDDFFMQLRDMIADACRARIARDY